MEKGWSNISVTVALLACTSAGLYLGRLSSKSQKRVKKSLKTKEEIDKIKREIAAVTPYYKYKGIDRFYDISGFLRHPDVFQKVIDLFAEHYKNVECTAICGIDARGFILGPPVALALNKPFFMVRKKDKLPACITGKAYRKEYEGDDSLSVPVGAIDENDKVIIIDDLVATGGSVLAALELVEHLGGKCVGVACVIEIAALNARERLKQSGFADVEIFSVIEEHLLTVDGSKLSSPP